jgi:hypothetical protein
MDAALQPGALRQSYAEGVRSTVLVALAVALVLVLVPVVLVR